MYLIICKDNSAFYTDWYQYQNHWNDGIFCIVCGYEVTFDGKTWEKIESDHL